MNSRWWRGILFQSHPLHSKENFWDVWCNNRELLICGRPAVAANGEARWLAETSHVHNVGHSRLQSRFQWLLCSVAAVCHGHCLSVPKAMEGWDSSEMLWMWRIFPFQLCLYAGDCLLAFANNHNITLLVFHWLYCTSIFSILTSLLSDHIWITAHLFGIHIIKDRELLERVQHHFTGLFQNFKACHVTTDSISLVCGNFRKVVTELTSLSFSTW